MFIRRGQAGVYVDEAWYCSTACVALAARNRLHDELASAPTPTAMPTVPTVRLGALLRHQGAITAADLTAALEAQKTSKLRIGEQLIAMGATNADAVLKGLAAQFGVSYLCAVGPSRVHDSPAGLSRDEVRALNVVPFSVNNTIGSVMVACTAPVPRAALAALRQLTGFVPEPYLVTDANFDLLLAEYGRSSSAARAARHFVRMRGVLEAAERIAAVAAEERAISVTEAHCAPYMWVRVAGKNIVDTLIVPQEERECPVAITSH